MDTSLNTTIKINNKNILIPFNTTVIACYSYYFFEWIFFYTKPSMLSYLSAFEKIEILFSAPLLALIFVLPVPLGIWLIVSVSIKLANLHSKYLISICLLVPALLLALLFFLLIDNFTYTIFEIASYTSSSGISKILYLSMFLLFSYFFNKKLIDDINIKENRKKYTHLYSKLSLILVTFSIISLFTSYQKPLVQDKIHILERPSDLPNILIFSADGVNSSYMSVYGYEKSTTPFLQSIASETLRFENHFTNASATTGSVGALLSGKYPSRTKVIFPPDTFSNIHMFEHLPSYLKNLGYFNIDISIRHYVDPIDLKMRGSFDIANERIITHSNDKFLNFGLLRWPASVQFLEENIDRVMFRLLHITNIKQWKNPFALVTQDFNEQLVDQPRIDSLKEHLKNSNKPFFINVHLLGPHGGKFYYDKPMFTETKIQNENWIPEHYENAIYQWDSYAKEIYELLLETKQLENTLLIFNSDHGFKHNYKESIPLILRFPNQDIKGVEVLPSQRIDIAPTIIEYLGLPIPKWLDGKSLISRSDTPYPIFISTESGTQKVKVNDNNWRVNGNINPPFYSLGSLSVAYCGNVYTLNLLEQEDLKITDLPTTPKQCSEKIINSRYIYSLLEKHLSDMGFQTESLNFIEE